MVLLIPLIPLFGGYGGYPYLGPSIFGILGYKLRLVGIIPCLILKILLIVTPLLLLPPIALGAFVLGKGTGLLIGKMLAMKLMMKAYRFHNKHAKRNHGWKSLYQSTGWKPPTNSLFPFIQKFKLHASFPPPPHFNFHIFKPLGRIKGSAKPYGSYEGWNQGEAVSDDTSGWLPGPPPETWGSKGNEHAHDSGYHEGHSSDSDSAHDHHYSPTENADVGNAGFSDSMTSGASVSKDLENFIRSQVHKLSKPNASGGTSAADAIKIEKYLNEAFTQDIISSMAEGTIPDFIPFPDYDRNKTSKGRPKLATLKNRNDEDINILSEASDFKYIAQDDPFEAVEGLDPVQYVPHSVLAWLTGTNYRESFTDDNETHRSKRNVENTVNVAAIVRSVARDIRNLFRIISMLDIGRCLEKTVCDIHSQEAAERQSNSFESNVITAFRIINTIMPTGEDEHVAKYKAAAEIGASSRSSKTCVNTFSSCPMPSSSLIAVAKHITPNI